MNGFTDATELAKQLRQRQRSAVETVQDAIDRIEALNPSVNAVVTRCYDEALRNAQRADDEAAAGHYRGPLHGVPVLIKDLFDFRAGLRNTFGCRAMVDFVPDSTSAHIQRLEDAGAIVLGKTNTPEFGHKGLTDNRLFGATRCPFDVSRNAGGSSGGSAAAVALGMTAVAQGSDAGGSIRIPAAWCGVVGLKLTFGRVPNTGGPNAFGTHTPFVHAGPIARTVRDAALMGQVLSGPHDDDPFSLPDDGLHLLGAVDRGTRDLRVGFSRDWGRFVVDQQVASVVEACVGQLQYAGIAVEEADIVLPLKQDELAALWIRQVGVIYAEIFETLAEDGCDLLRDHAEDVPDEIHQMVAVARSTSALAARQDEIARSLVWKEVQRAFSRYDILLTPTVSALPVQNDEGGRTLGPQKVDGKPVERTIGWCLTHPLNFTGHPAASVPAGLAENGLPVGLQVIGRRFRDDQVISVCRAIEKVCPWLPVLERVTTRVFGERTLQRLLSMHDFGCSSPRSLR